MFCAACAFAFLGRSSLVARRPDPFGPSARAAMAFAVVFWLSVSWMVRVAPDWMLNYFVPAEEISLPAVHGVFLVCLLLAALSGHTVTAVLLQRRRLFAALGVLAAGLVAWLGLWALTIDRYMAIGTHLEFLSGAAAPLQESHIVGAMNVIGAIQGLTLVTLGIIVFRAGRRLRPA